MNYCPTCGQGIKSAATNDLPPVAIERKYIKIPSADAFREICNLVLQSPNCTEQKFRGALEDFPKAVQKYGQLTEGQWKFFCAIYKNVFDAWPPKPEAIVTPVLSAAPLDVDDVPF